MRPGRKWAGHGAGSQGHVSNKAAKRANRKRSALSVIGLQSPARTGGRWYQHPHHRRHRGLERRVAAPLSLRQPCTRSALGALPLARLRLRSSGLAGCRRPPRLQQQAYPDLGFLVHQPGLRLQQGRTDRPARQPGRRPVLQAGAGPQTIAEPIEERSRRRRRKELR